MLFSKNKKVTLVDLKEHDPDNYSTIVEEVKTELNIKESEALEKANKTIVELTTKLERHEADSMILAYGEKLQVVDVAKKAVEEKLDFNTALKKIVDANIEKVKSLTDSFDDSSSSAAGSTGDLDNHDVEPKTFVEAIHVIAERDKITKKEAAIKAQKEYKTLFDAQYPEKDK